VDGLDGGTKDINAGTLQIGGTEIVNGSRAATFTAITTTGDITSTGAAIDWDLIDNNASALSFDASGKAGILAIVTTDSSEGVTMSGTLAVTGIVTLSSDISTTGQASDWDLVDNNASALSFDASGKSGILEIVTTDSSEGVKMSGYLNIGASTAVSSVLDEDDLSSDSATALATQQSIKAYVDSQVGTVDTWQEVMTNGNTYYVATNDGNPQMRIGATDAEELHIQAVYDSGAQTLDYVLFETDAASATADKGEYRFNVDGTVIAHINDSGVNVVSGKAYYINDTSVLNATTLGTAVVTSSLTTVGALDSGSITSGFGTIDVGSSAIDGGTITGSTLTDGTATLTSGAWTGITTVTMGGDLTIYEATNDANPEIRLGAANAEEFHIQAVYDSGAQTLDYVLFETEAASATADKGEFRFSVDETVITHINDSGVNVVSGKAYYINDTSVLNATTLGSAVVTSSLTTVGALDSGSITSGFGSIDVGSSAIDGGTITGSTLTDGTATLTSGAWTGITTVTMVGDLTIYDANNDGNPQIRLGASDAEELQIQAVYDSGAQTLDYVIFETQAASATADKGEYRFSVDQTEIAQINDSGINIVTGSAFYINDTSVLSATTLGSGVTASSLTSVGTLTSLTTSGVILGPDGSASAPTYSWSGDTNTGIFRSDGDEISFTLGGTVRTIINSTELAVTSAVLSIPDGSTAPTAVAGKAYIYVDTSDGDLKVRFGDGTTKVLAADT
jgi:hypothetical protein